MNTVHNTPTHRALTIASVRTDNYRTKTFTFTEDLPAQPGQFVMAWLPGVDEKPFSIASSAPFALTIVAVGKFSEAIHRLQPGDRLWVRGPLGQGYRFAPASRLLLVGGGYGAAPLHYLAVSALAQACSVEVCLGAQSAADVILAAEFAHASIPVRITTNDGSLGKPGLVTAAVEDAIAAQKPDLICACGPVKMLQALDQLGARYDIPRQLSWEAHMRCGMGLCGSCEIPDFEPGAAWLACLDGPVLESR